MVTGFRCWKNLENLRKTELPEQANHGVVHKKPAFTIHKWVVYVRIIHKNLSQTSVRQSPGLSFSHLLPIIKAMTLRLSWPIHFYPIIQSFDFLPDSICKGQSRLGSGLWCIQQLAAPEFCFDHTMMQTKGEQARNWKQRCKLPNHESWLQSGRK